MPIVPLYQNPAKDGGPLGWLSCNSTCTAMLIAFETAGASRPSGGDVRACTLDENGLPDITGGTTPAQNVDAAKRCWQVTLDYQVMDFERFWALSARPDYAISVSISYAVVSGGPLDGSPGFRGLHQVVRSGGPVYDPLADGRRPGIPNGPKTWPKALLRRAAGKFAGTGEGRACVIVAKAPAVKPTRYSVRFEPGAIWTYPEGATSHDPADRVVIGKLTSASCTAPFSIPWPGGRKRVVEMTAGFLAGKRVEPTATHLKLVTA